MRDLMSETCGSKSPRSEPPREHRLAGQAVRVGELTERELAQMYALLERYFAGVTRQQFESDLAEKEWAIVLRDALNERVQGFSTLMQLRTVIDEQPIVAFFSGDTIIHRDYWGETALPRLWGRHVFNLADQIRKARVYWFLICSGYKTYRYLPLFLREFYPSYQRPTPPELKRLLDQLGQLKFGSEYDAARGVIRFKQNAPLRAGVAELTPQRLKDPHVAFFAENNPGHINGDELACLAELSRDNLTPAGRRMIGTST